MALVIDRIRSRVTGSHWVSPERLCVTADGRVVDELDPDGVRLLVAKGGRLPLEEARKYGLVDETPAKERKGETKERKEAETKGGPAGGGASSPVPAEPTAGPSLGKMNKGQLQALAAELGVETGGSNADLIERIQAARAAGGDEPTGGEAEPTPEE